MDLILFGIQGSGKGTQGKKIAKKYGLKIFETGAELRKIANENSELGHTVKSIIESGKLVSNDLVMKIVLDFISKIPNNINVLFDGIPRSIQQNETLTAFLKEKKRNFKGILIELSRDEAIKRLTTRRVCKNCKENYPVSYKKNTCKSCGGPLVARSDDNIESINTRLDTFEKKTAPIIKSFKNQNNIIIINGEQDIEKVSNEIFEKLDIIYT